MLNNKRQRPGVAFLASMKLGLALLLLLGGLASLGSFLPQGQPEGFYRLYYGELAGKLIILLSLDHVYKSWWFLTLGALLALNLLTCSVQRIKKAPGWRGWGSIILHLSILVILAGAVTSGVLAHQAHIEVGVGDSLDLADKGFPGLVLTVKDFNIEYYDDFQPRQYISNVNVQAGKQQIEQAIWVNHPLKLGSLKIYQASYGWLVRGQTTVGGKGLPFDLASGRSLTIDQARDLRLVFFFIPDFSGQDGTLHSRSPRPNNPRLAAVLLEDRDVMAREILAVGETRDVGDYPVTFAGYRYYSGLEIKRDPGVRIIYAGFIVLLLGFGIRYLMPDKA